MLEESLFINLNAIKLFHLSYSFLGAIFTQLFEVFIMVKVDRGIFPFYVFSNLSAQENIIHFVSSGVKSIGFTENIPDEIIRNKRQDLAKAVGFDYRRWVTAHQVHSAHVAVVKEADAGKGAMDKESRLPDTDALVTNQPDVCLMVLSADCVPVLLYDPECQVIAAIHAGWKGTAAKIVAEAVRTMQQEFGCSSQNILAGIGPSIGKCCFEVGEDVAEIFRHLYPQSREFVTEGKAGGKAGGKYQVDLWAVNRQELIEAGLKPENIEIAGLCSMCHPDHFFSYRRDGKLAGRFGAGIVLRGAL